MPNQTNAHPQQDAQAEVSVVHNGILENDFALRDALQATGVRFASDTDTEVFAHLFARHFEGGPVAAARELLARCRGQFALAIQHVALPDTLIAVRRGSPLIVGLGVRENLVASDLRALMGRADRRIDLGEDEIALVRPDSVEVFDASGARVDPVVLPMGDMDLGIGKDGHAHYMHKEICEQPQRIYELTAARLDPTHDTVRLDEVSLDDAAWRALTRVDFVGCGTAFYACLYGAQVLEMFARIPTRAIQAHEYDVRMPTLDERVLVVALSQSGETMDTKLAVDVARNGGARTLGVLNVRESVIGRLADDVLHIHAGLEVSVASTKVYTSMLAALLLLALRAATARGTAAGILRELEPALRALPEQMRRVLTTCPPVAETIARDIHRAKSMLYMGRGIDVGTACEGALKMKEISYIHAEGYAAGELKHGPIALVSREVPTVAIATAGVSRDRMIGNVREIRARDGEVILVATEGDAEAERVADFVLPVPPTHPHLGPMLNALPLQLLAYETAKRRGCDIDQPRNLAKTVTVQ